MLPAKPGLQPADALALVVFGMQVIGLKKGSRSKASFRVEGHISCSVTSFDQKDVGVVFTGSRFRMPGGTG